MSTLVIWPISVPSTLAMVLSWNEPSRVTRQEQLAAELWNSNLDQTTLILWVFASMFLAEAVLSAEARSMAAISAVSPAPLPRASASEPAAPGRPMPLSQPSPTQGQL